MVSCEFAKNHNGGSIKPTEGYPVKQIPQNLPKDETWRGRRFPHKEQPTDGKKQKVRQS